MEERTEPDECFSVREMFNEHAPESVWMSMFIIVCNS